MFAMYELPEIGWNLLMIYGLYVIYKRVAKAAQNPVVRKTAAREGINLIQRLLK